MKESGEQYIIPVESIQLDRTAEISLGISEIKAGIATEAMNPSSKALVIGNSDKGLYCALTQVASDLDYQLGDDNSMEVVMALGPHRRGVNMGGEIILVKKEGKADMAATLAHELGHNFHMRIEEHYIPSESWTRENEVIAESVAFIVCRNFGLDTSIRTFPYISQHLDRDFENYPMEKIRSASMWLIASTERAKQLKTKDKPKKPSLSYKV